MAVPDADIHWLPDHQLHVVFTLAHVDDLISRAADIHFRYVSERPLTIDTISDASESRVVVTSVAPLPEALSRYTADALTQLRAAIEHVIFASVEQQLGRPLTSSEARAIEMPCYGDEQGFAGWLRDRRRAQLAPLQADSELVGRLRKLQPFAASGVEMEDHPLKILVEHTNVAKHRTPAVASTRLGAVFPDVSHPDLRIVESTGTVALSPGDVLAVGPHNLHIGLSIVPTVAIKRPHTGNWSVLMNEFGLLEEWVRLVAIPVLITGNDQVTPGLPSQLDTTVGHSDARAALRLGGRIPAAQRAINKIAAAGGRENLVALLQESGIEQLDAQLWVNGLDDERVVVVIGMLGNLGILGIPWLHEQVALTRPLPANDTATEAPAGG